MCAYVTSVHEGFGNLAVHHRRLFLPTLFEILCHISRHYVDFHFQGRFGRLDNLQNNIVRAVLAFFVGCNVVLLATINYTFLLDIVADKLTIRV